MTIRVLLADDQALLRQTFNILISATPMWKSSVKRPTARKPPSSPARHPDVVVMDIRMPGTDGLAATEAICGDPDLAGTRILILTTYETDEYVARALRARRQRLPRQGRHHRRPAGRHPHHSLRRLPALPPGHPRAHHPLPHYPRTRQPPGILQQPRPAHRPETRSDGPGRRGLLQRGDRRQAVPQHPHSPHPHPAGHGETACPRPRPARRHRLPGRPRPPRSASAI
jgi:CheY-like chemotaxis protein